MWARMSKPWDPNNSYSPCFVLIWTSVVAFDLIAIFQCLRTPFLESVNFISFWDIQFMRNIMLYVCWNEQKMSLFISTLDALLFYFTARNVVFPYLGDWKAIYFQVYRTINESDYEKITPIYRRYIHFSSISLLLKLPFILPVYFLEEMFTMTYWVIEN